jgi:hypothetical protein
LKAELFEHAKPDWRGNRLIARGCQYTEIRIISPSASFNNGTGRKGSSETIRAAIAALQGDGVDLCGMARKSACEAIRRKIGKEFPNKGSGLSDINLSKYILEVCPQRGIDN